jgi:GT2 family glycosyltransferase
VRSIDEARFTGGGGHADVAAVVVTYNSESDIAALISDLRLAACDRPIRLIVVDNQSSDDTARIVSANSDVIFVDSGGNLGYAGGINVGLGLVEDCDAVLILNPDLALKPHAITRLFEALDNNGGIGAVVPLIRDSDGATFPSLRREPSITRAIGDALFGSKIRTRPGFSSEIDYRPASYLEPREVDWATGAALLVPAEVVREVGQWNESFFLFSEETDYFRRIRMSGRQIRFDPSAVVEHRGGGSGTSAHTALLAVNRIRYVELHRGRTYATAFRAVVALAEGIRSYDPVHRRNLSFVVSRRRWKNLSKSARKTVQQISGHTQRGAVIVPANNEAAVIKRTLAPLSRAAVDGYIELIVVCNGCTDDTADIARSVPGVTVVELEQGSKPAALNAGDSEASLWPRLYLDADIQISAEAVLAVLDRLAQGDVLVARPDARHDYGRANAFVRSFYRARNRIPQNKLTMIGAGAYGLNEDGHRRFGAFPPISSDDLYVDTRFAADEKTVVATDPVVVTTPADVKNLLAIIRRGHRGAAELVAREHTHNGRVRNTGLETARSVVRTIRGPRSALDAAAYLGVALSARLPYRSSQVWERDESSRLLE